MMLSLMALVLALGLTGYLQTTDMFWGEEWLEELHEGLAYTLLGLAALLRPRPSSSAASKHQPDRRHDDRHQDCAASRRAMRLRPCPVPDALRGFTP